jgi:hypothetical protein
MVKNESQVACPTCSAEVASAELNSHLLQTHQSYAFRGVVRSIADTRRLILAAVCRSEPDVEAWRALESIATHERGERVDAFLATTLAQLLERLSPEERKQAVLSLAILITEHGLCPNLVLQQLAKNSNPISRRLAWAMIDRAPKLLTSDILEGLLAGLRTQPALEQLQRLERRIGANPLIEKARQAREQNVRMRCYFCSAELRRADMIRHLWTVHGMVLDGHRPRDPWIVIDEWIVHYVRRHRDKYLKRACALAERCDPKNGLRRVYARFLACGLHHAEARAHLLAEAAETHGTLCPNCYTLVAMPEQDPPAKISLSHGRLSANGYRVEIRESGLTPRLEISMPGASDKRSPLPGPRLTRRAAMLCFVGPLLVIAVLLAVVPLPIEISPLVPVLTFVLPALAFGTWIRFWGMKPAPASDRAVERAWSKLVPALHDSGFYMPDSRFLAGLTVATIGRPGAADRARALERVLNITEKAAINRPNLLYHLAALQGLAISDAVAEGEDVVKLTSAQIRRCIDGRLALPYADKLLSLWPREWKTRANLSRLRLLFLDQAFEAGFEVRDLLAAGQTAPELGCVIGTDDPGELARLRLLWSLRPRRPWDRCGDAENAFGLAGAAAGGRILAANPDLLLYRLAPVSRKRGAETVEIIVSGRGVSVAGKLFSEPVRTIEVTPAADGSTLIIGDERITVNGDGDALAMEIERWLRYYFSEFVPMVAEVYRWRSPHAASILRAWGTLPCPECRQPFLARLGEVGIAVAGEEKAKNK